MEEALAGPDREKWLVSRDAEYQSLLENGTWDLVVLPEGKKAIQCKWVLRIKTDDKGQVTIYNSRLVAKGFMQKEKQDFNEIFAPTAKPPTLRLLLADAAVSGKFIIHMDISMAFLNGILEEDVYMTQPPGYEDGTGRVCKLKKSIYGLKQAPRCWYQKLAAVLEEMGFRTSSCDESLFLKGEGEKLVLFLVYVDDILLFSSSMKEIQNVQQQLMKNSKEQVDAAERVVKYLNSHPSIGVQYSASAQVKQKRVEVLKEKGERLGESKLFLTCFTDATWASENDDSSSVGGYISVVGGGPVSWRSKKQTEMALSSVESESGSRILLVSPPVQQTLLWHHRLGHPSLPRLRGMHSCLLVSGLTMSLPPLPPSPAPPCLPCVEGWQRAAPHSSSFPPTTPPLQILHMDVWGPARVSGQGRERYFLLVVDDYTRYTTVFPLRSKGEVSYVLIPWIRTVCLQLRERFGQDLPVMRLHSDRGGEFSSVLLRAFCRGEGILQSFTLPDSPQQNGIAERRIGLVMEVARTSMIHATAPHFLWPFVVRYAAHQFNLWPRVSLPETSPTLRWTGKVGDASVIRFYHPTSRRVLLSQDVTFDEFVPFYDLFPYRSAPPPPSPLFLAPGPPPVAVVSGASPDDASGGAASEGAASGGAEPGGAGSEGAGSRGAEPESVEPGGAESEGAESGGAEPRGAALSRGPVGASPRLSSQQLREWLVRRPHRQSGAPGAGGAIDSGAGGDPDAPDIPTPRSYAEAITGPYSSQWQAAMDAEMASWKSTGTYVDEGVDYFQTFSPTPKMTTLQVFLHVAAQRDYELHSLDFSTAFLQGSLHEEIWLRRPPGFTGTFPA
ncbi:unnamed protein product, partial [Closterium sp. NIES-53]